MSGSGVPAGRGSRSFDFGADDVLCSYDDFAAPSEPKRPDPADKVLLPPPPPSLGGNPPLIPRESWCVMIACRALTEAYCRTISPQRCRIPVNLFVQLNSVETVR